MKSNEWKTCVSNPRTGEKQNYITLHSHKFDNGYIKLKCVDGVYKVMVYAANKHNTVVSLLYCVAFDDIKEACDFMTNMISVIG